jgi:hypothetical protein
MNEGRPKGFNSKLGLGERQSFKGLNLLQQEEEQLTLRESSAVTKPISMSWMQRANQVAQEEQEIMERLERQYARGYFDDELTGGAPVEKS